MRTILESLPLLWFRLDARGTFIDFFVPPEMHALVLAPPGHFLGRTLAEVLPPDVAAQSAEALAGVLGDGEPRRFDYALPIGDTLHWFHCCMVAAGDSEVFAHVSDINAQRAAEDAMRRALAEAEASVQARTRFIATVSHEVRTPVNGILGMADLLTDTELDEEQRSYLTMLKAASRALLGVINDVLDFSKIEAGHLRVDEIAFSPRDLVEGVAALLAERAHSKGLELTVLVAHELPSTAIGDPKRIEQVLLNLLGNAIKFTPRGRVVMRATAARRTRAGLVARFEVEDTGIGISPEVQGLLFTPFVQGDPATTRRFGGTGLGLAISRRLVDLMGGEISLTSESGVGSCFVFDVPLLVPGGHRIRVRTDVGQLRARVDGWSCLIVSAGDLGAQLAHELEHAGVQSDVVADPDAAIARLEASPTVYRAVLVEIGDSAPVERLTSLLSAGGHIHRDVTFVALPRFGRRDAVALARRHPFEEVVTVPPRQRDLHALLRRLAPTDPPATDATA